MKCFIDSSERKADGTLIIRKQAKEIVPYSIEEMKEAISRTKNRECVVLDLERLPVDIAQRMLDFATGAMFAEQGSLRKIKGEKYLLIPQNVKVKKVREEK